MTKREIASLACKILAVWVFANAAFHVGGFVVLLLEALRSLLAYAQHGAVGGLAGWLSMQPALAVIFGLLGLILWRKSDALAARMVGADDAPVTGTDTTKADWLSIAFITVGMFLLVKAVGALAGQIVYTISSDELGRPSSIYPGDMLRTGVQAVLGLWLVVGSRGLARAIWRLRTAGVNPPQEEPPADDSDRPA